MPSERRRVFDREFKEAAVRRMVAGENVRALAAELGMWEKVLYAWRRRYEQGGVEALRPTGRPRRPARQDAGPEPVGAERGASSPADRIAELERKVGRQAVELDFFKQALRHVTASAPRNGGRGARPSSS